MGLYFVIIRALFGAGIVHDVGRMWRCRYQSRNHKCLVDLRLVELVTTYDRGLIRYRPECVQPIRIYEQIIRALPEGNCTILVRSRDDVVPTVRQLRGLGIDAFGHKGQSQLLVKKSVSVATTAGMASNPIEPEKQQVVIVANAAEVIGKHSIQYLHFSENARLYGLLDDRCDLSPFENDLVRSLFGYHETTIPRHGYQIRPTRVEMVEDVLKAPRVHRAESVDVLRSGVWRNEARNRLVARYAMAISAGDAEFIARCLSPEFPRSRKRVFVLVENIDHAVALLPKLPAWPLISSCTLNLVGLSDAQIELARSRLIGGDASPLCGVVTQAGLSHVRMPLHEMNVLIRADAGDGVLCLPEKMMILPAVENIKPLLVVDFFDRAPAVLRCRSGRRFHGYQRAGWPMLGEQDDWPRMRFDWQERWRRVER